MNLHMDLQKIIYVEALNNAVYIINHKPSNPLDMKFLEEKWSEKEVNLSHHRVFDAVVYMYIYEASRE